jgi:hypothetical protein
MQSHKLIFEALCYLTEKIEDVANRAGGEGVDRLCSWVEFLGERARVGVIEVPTEADAYVIFETLNNRGADLTTADLLKNYLYSRADMNIDSVREHWARALGTLELTAADARFTAFLRHYWSSLHGLTREKDLYKEIKIQSRPKSAIALGSDGVIAQAGTSEAPSSNGELVGSRDDTRDYELWKH